MQFNEPLPVGVFARLNDEPDQVFARIRAAGFSYCQLAAPSDAYLYGPEGRRNTRLLLNALEAHGVTATSVFMSFPGQNWELDQAPATLGLVPEKFRAERIARACRTAAWARELGVDTLAAHVGFVPEDAQAPLYQGFIAAMRGLALFLESQGQIFTFETGQESVAVLKRTMADIGTDNLGINFDPANLLLYNMDDPAVLVKELGTLVRHVHCKDGVRPARPGILGEEKRLGEGAVGFAGLLRSLSALGYRGPLTIEREIAPGAQQNADILHAKQLIENLKKEMLHA